jgi:hypothetical protein
MKSSSRSEKLQSINACEQRHIPWLFCLVLGLITAIPFGFGKYFEFNTNDPYDSGAYVYSAKRILDGAQMGTEARVSARMGTLLVNMLGVRLFGFSETGPKFMQMIFQIVALCFMFAALWRLWGKWAAGISTFIAAFYLSAPVIAKFGNVKEQYMIACMIVGVSCYVFRQLGGGWGWTVAAGAVLAWGPLFKQTGLSAIGAVGLFALMQPVFKTGTWKQAGREVLLLFAGAALSLMPVFIWLGLQQAPFEYWPYAKIIRLVLPVGGERVSTYISKGRQLIDMKVVAYRVFRYYGILILPVVLAIASICYAGLRWVAKKAAKTDRFVALFGVWWILDMAFIWISPRSYEQYYLPLNASGVMLGAFVLHCYCTKLRTASFKVPWMVIGAFGCLLMIALSQHIVFGIEKSPHSGTKYPQKKRGYVQRWREIRSVRMLSQKLAWEALAAYIKQHTQPEDQIFVWGWFPGIYVQAQRMSAAAYACTSEMHVRSPEALTEMIEGILADFKRHPPKYIVDSRKNHFPWKQPPLELWPLVRTRDGKRQLLPKDEASVTAYERQWFNVLNTQVGEEEAERFQRMKPFREYVRRHYTQPRLFGTHLLMQLDPTTLDQE